MDKLGIVVDPRRRRKKEEKFLRNVLSVHETNSSAMFRIEHWARQPAISWLSAVPVEARQIRETRHLSNILKFESSRREANEHRRDAVKTSKKEENEQERKRY